MTPWDAVVAATEGHDLSKVSVHLDGGKSWAWVECSCGSETFTEDWQFTDHIRRIVFAALSGAAQEQGETAEHRRRSPCCADEARRYLASVGT